LAGRVAFGLLVILAFAFTPEAVKAQTGSGADSKEPSRASLQVSDPDAEPSKDIAGLPPDYAERLKDFKPLQLPPEPPDDHRLNSVLDLGPIRQSTLLHLTKTRPIKLEASYNEPLSLAEVLDCALTNSLPIKISQESLNFQHFQFMAQAVDVLPNFSTGFSLGQANINTVTTAYNRIYSASLRYPVFQGGAVLYSTLSQYYRQKGWISSHRATINDALLDVYQKYNNLVLSNAILQIRAKSLAISESQLALNDAIYKSGNGTQFAIMQSRTQLAADRQALLAQQVLVRQAAMALAFALDMPMAINIVPSIDIVCEQAILDDKVAIKDMLDQALATRPELRQYECFRLAAARNVQASASSLYPQASFFTTYTHSTGSVFPTENTAALNGLASATINSSLFGTGLATNAALNQAASFSPTGNNLGNSGVNTVATVVAASGGNPIATTQSGSLVTSGAVAPSFASGSSAFGSGGSNINGSNTTGAGVFPGLFNNFQAGFTIAWSLSNLGSNAITGIGASRTLARQAMIQANQELQLVVEQVRSSFLNSIAAHEQIDSAAHGVASTTEELRLANLRLAAGMGTNLELIQAQRDYVNALISQAQAIVASNQAQVQLLHDSGLISRETILHGWRLQNVTRKPAKKRWRPKT
jgi:outer membrane protein TolC